MAFCFRTATCLALSTLMISAAAFGQRPSGLLPIRTVEYDQRGVFRVNGKPFFPIVVYDAPLDEQTLRELRDFGFNVLACDAQACPSLPAKGFYGACHADKRIDDLTGTFMGIGMDSPALNFKKDLLKQVAEANAKTHAAVPGRPIMNAIGYWEDEPSGVIAGKLPAKSVYEVLVAAIDVSAPYLYPVPYQPVSSVGDAVARARKASAGTKPVLPVLQLFVWNAKDRYPTPDELRCMAFLALVEGAHGIGYYSYGSVTGRPKTSIAAAQPELWKSVKKLNHDLRDIGPRLLSGSQSNDATLGTGTSSVRMKCVRQNGEVLAVVVNTASTRQEAKLLCKDLKVGQLTSRAGRHIPVTEGTATLVLDAFGIEVVHLATRK